MKSQMQFRSGWTWNELILEMNNIFSANAIEMVLFLRFICAD